MIGSHLASDFIYEFHNPCGKLHEKKAIHIARQDSHQNLVDRTGLKSLPESTTRYQTKETAGQFPLKDSSIFRESHGDFYSLLSRGSRNQYFEWVIMIWSHLKEDKQWVELKRGTLGCHKPHIQDMVCVFHSAGHLPKSMSLHSVSSDPGA